MSTSGFSFGNVATTPSTTASTGFSLPTATTATTSAGFSLNTTASTASTTAVPTVSFSFPTTSKSTPTTTTKSTLSIAPAGTTTTASSTTTSATGILKKDSQEKQLNYAQLQELTNKWITDFEELQKILMNQTSDTVARDIIINTNHSKMEKLVKSIEEFKLEQKQVEQQLDFIVSQQKDLEESLTTLEEEVSALYPDIPADDLYKMVENVDSRLKKTLETSKEVIVKINEKNRSSENTSNPLVAIGQILNHHTNSIYMLDSATVEAQNKLNELQSAYDQFSS